MPMTPSWSSLACAYAPSVVAVAEQGGDRRHTDGTDGHGRSGSGA